MVPSTESTTATAIPPPPPERPSPAGLRKAAWAGLIGTTLENYDSVIYGTASALVLSELCFPTVSPVVGMIASFSAHAAGFVARPLGGKRGRYSSLVMVGAGTRLHPGSTWNTMPAHTHDRRTEVYLYTGLPADARVVHILGEPSQTRHLLVADGEAVVSPPWSVHCGVGTAAYTFVWAMAGENQSFDDMDGCAITDLR